MPSRIFCAQEGGPAEVRLRGQPQGHCGCSGFGIPAKDAQGVFDMLQQFDRPEITSNGEFQQQAELGSARPGNCKRHRVSAWARAAE